MIDICPKIHHNGKCVILDSSKFFFMEKKENKLKKIWLSFFLKQVEAA